MPKHIAEQFVLPTTDNQAFAKTLGRHREDSHLEEPFNDADLAIGERLAEVIGDTFLDYQLVAPTTQWACIVRALRAHGMKVVNDEAGAYGKP